MSDDSKLREASEPHHEAEGDDATAGDHPPIAQVVPLPTLVGVFGVLVALTLTAVAVTAIDFGPTANLVVAMVIATIQAGLCVAVFMHLWYDRSIHLLLLLTSVLFVVLLISFLVIDRVEYQPSIDEFEAARQAAADNG